MHHYLRESFTPLLWKPKIGWNTIDIIPYSNGYVLNLLVHYEIGVNNETIICPRTWGDTCPICDYINKWEETKNLPYDEIKPLTAKRRCLYNIVVQGEEQKGVQLWDVPRYYSEDAFSLLAKVPATGGPILNSRTPSIEEIGHYLSEYHKKYDRYIDFADPIRGKSISFDYSFDSHFRHNCFRYRGQCFNDRDNPISNKLLNEAYNLDVLIHRLTQEEVYTLFYHK